MTQQRGHGFQTNSLKPSKTGNTYLMVVAIDQYKHNWPDLTFPVRHCEDLINVLTEKYGAILDPNIGGFLTNESATRKSVLQKLTWLRKQDIETNEYLIKKEDSIILIFAGHGYQDSRYPYDPGYLAMNNSKVPTPPNYDELSKLISGDQLVNILSHVPAKHILIIVDSCFSSSFSKRHINIIDTIEPKKAIKSVENPSRWIMTSGRNEPVPDKSHFALALLSELTENTSKDLSVRGLFSRIEERLKLISCPNPLLDDLVVKEFNGGEFRFVLRLPALKGAAPSTRDNNFNKNRSALAKELRLGSQKYKEQLHKGRFQHLNIAQVLLAETDLPEMEEPVVSMDNNLSYLSKAVSSLWEKEKRHVLLIGSGGMGKTVSLLNLWGEFLEKESLPIPLFIGLNEYNQIIREEDKIGFILRYISLHYLGKRNLTADLENELWDLLTEESGENRPGIVLLFDGFNEVTSRRDQLVSDLNEIVSKAINVQLIVSSRYAEIQQYHWTRSSTRIDLVTLATIRIEEYLGNVGGNIPANPELITLLGNPMMLAIYASTDSIITKYSNDSRFKFHSVQTVAELLWNFQEAHLAKNLEALEGNEIDQVYVTFLTRYLVPFLGWRMEKEGQFFISADIAQNIQFNFNNLIGEACRYLRRRGALAVYPKIVSIPERLFLGDPESDLDDLARSDKIQETLVKNLHLMVGEGNELRFLHQNFRDFYAACHLRNSILFSIAEGSRPLEWKERVIPIYLRKMLGEIEGEYFFDSSALLGGAEVPKRISINLIAKLLDACRQDNMDEDCSVWNLVSILNEARCNLAGVDLSAISMSGFNFNSIKTFVHQNNNFINPILNNTRISGNQFIYQGHISMVKDICYSPCGKKILTASYDTSIKEWLVETGELLNTFLGHSSSVNSISYSPLGERILSASQDGTIIEWMINTKVCTLTLKGHSGSVNDICYNRDGSMIVSGSEDKTIKFWMTSTGECLKTLQGHAASVNTVSYSPCKMKILSASNDCTLREWLIKTGECLHIFHGHDSAVNTSCYSPNGDKILSASYDGTIREWSTTNRNCIQIIKGPDFPNYHTWLEWHHKEALFNLYAASADGFKKLKFEFKFQLPGPVNSVCYSPNGDKILSAWGDGSIREYVVFNNESTQIFEKIIVNNFFPPFIESSKYSPCGQKIICIYGNAVEEFYSFSRELTLKLQSNNKGVNLACYSFCGKRILSGLNDGSIKEFAVNTGICVRNFIGHANSVSSVCYSMDGNKILSTSRFEFTKEWSIATGKCILTVGAHSDWVYSALYSLDGERIYFSNHIIGIREWSINTIQSLRSIDGLKGDICYVYGSQGEEILIIKNHKEIEIYGVHSGKCVNTYLGHSKNVNYACPSPDTERMVSASEDKTIKEWSISSGKCLRTLVGHLEKVNFVSFNRNGNKILSASDDRTIKEWDLETGVCIRTLTGHSNCVNSVLYSPCGQKILSSSSDGTIKEWSVKTGNCIQTIHNEIGLFTQGLDLRHLHPDSNFTEDEKERLRRYGAIFTDEDEVIWNETLADAYGEDENDII